MKRLFGILGITGALLMATAAYAQAPGAPAVDTTVTTTTTTETDPAMGGVIVGEYDTVGTMPATGGAPLAMALAGTLTAAGAFLIRRKLS